MRYNSNAAKPFAVGDPLPVLIHDDYIQHVGILYVKTGDEIEAPEPIATAFFVSMTLKTNSGLRWVTYAVTCKHVVEPYRANDLPLFLRVNDKAEGYVDFKTLGGHWHYHADTDIALIRVEFPAGQCSYKSCDTDTFATNEQIAELGIGVGDEVFYAVSIIIRNSPLCGIV